MSKPNFAQKSRDMIDDLVMLDQIKEDKIAQALKKRYDSDAIYTNIGPVLIAINPFKMIHSYYGVDKMKAYRGKKYFEVPPHVYAVADDTYRSMISLRERMCVIVSGESGAGKTETCKIFMNYISSATGKSAEVQRVKDRMLASNPILEAFGNAKTVNNNNSSRFGKYMQITFDYGGDPVGGLITTYLLEKSRVVGPGPTERNFHVFYLLCKAAPQHIQEQMYLQGCDYFNYLNVSGTYDVPGIDDNKWYQEMEESFQTIGFSDDEKMNIYKCLSAILWLGNVTFSQDHKEASQCDQPDVLAYAAAILEVDAQHLEQSMITREVQVGYGRSAEVFKKPQTAENAYFSRDTLAKALYSQMFDFIVTKVNKSIEKKDFDGLLIGVLDIYGFEIFKNNGFEQLCINFVNEKLQQIFIDLTLKSEQDEYAAEGIPWKEIKYQNNKPICEFIENKPGLLSLCDDCCNTNKTDDMFVNDLGQRFGSTGIVQCGNRDFVIKHFAGTVRYDSVGFLIKNQDTLFDDLKLVVQSSPAGFVQQHGWSAMQISSGQKKRPISVGSAFRKQVGNLMKELRSCVPHYIRCIKPNNTKKANDWDNKQSLRQIKYLGLLENVKVRRAGYANRNEYVRFANRYKLLSTQAWTGQFRGSPKDLTVHLCQTLGWQENREYALGKTKIFISEASSLFFIEEMLERKIDEAVVVVQKAYRAFKQKRYYLQSKVDGYDLMKGQKERRRGSVDRQYKGDYCDFSYNKMVQDLLSMNGQREKLLFSDRATTAILQSKKSAFARMFSKDTSPITEPRFLVLSDQAVYSFRLEPEARDPKMKIKKGERGPWMNTTCTVFFRVGFHEIDRIVLSTFADDWMVVHFTAGDGARKDVMMSVRRKTEFLALLKKAKPSLQIQFLVSDSIIVNFKKKTKVDINWIQAPSIGKTAKLIKPKEGKFEIHSPSGIPSSQVQEPFRPGEGQVYGQANTGGKRVNKLRALYDFTGGTPAELSFSVGDVMEMTGPENGGWFDAKLNGKAGIVPATYVEMFQEVIEEKKKPQPMARPAMKQPASSGPRWGGGGGNTGGGGVVKSTQNSYRPGGKFAPSMPAKTTGPPARGPPPMKAKCKWDKLHDPNSGDYYYCHVDTNESVWDKPADCTCA